MQPVGRSGNRRYHRMTMIRSFAACDLAVTRCRVKRTCDFSYTVYRPHSPTDNNGRNPSALSPYSRPQPCTGLPLRVIEVETRRGRQFQQNKRPRYPLTQHPLAYDLKTLSPVFGYVGLTHILTYFCYNFHSVPVIENHPITAHVAAPVTKALVAPARPRHPQPSISPDGRIPGL